MALDEQKLKCPDCQAKLKVTSNQPVLGFDFAVCDSCRTCWLVLEEDVLDVEHPVDMTPPQQVWVRSLGKRAEYVKTSRRMALLEERCFGSSSEEGQHPSGFGTYYGGASWPSM